jgi:hypothetical protein
MWRRQTFILYLGLFCSDSFAQNSAWTSSPQTSIGFLNRPISLDGRVDLNEWEGATLIDDFTEVEPNEGALPAFKTSCYVARDDENIYFAFICEDPEPEKMVLQNLSRDAFLRDDDRIEIVLDTFHNRQSAYFFQMSAAGSRGDALIGENGRRFNKPWNGFWDGEALIDENGWSCEIAIPFKTMRAGQDDSWGLNIQRYRGASRSEYRWANPRREVFLGNISAAGTLNGFSDMPDNYGLEFRPYFKSKRIDSRTEGLESQYDFGGELHWSITSSLKASFTWNTDFAETEVDDRRVNLTRFSQFFPEKRDFFLQDSTLFEFGEQGRGSRNILPFFSRTIGLADGSPIDIDYGLRLVGREGDFEIGALGVQTASHQSLNIPAGNLFVLRPSYRYNTNHNFGGLLTSGNPSALGSNSVVGLDHRYSSTELFGVNFSSNTFFVNSFDEDAGERGLGFGNQMRLRGKEWSYEFSLMGTQEEFLPAMGYVRRPGEVRSQVSVEYEPIINGDIIRNYDFGLTPTYWSKLDGTLVSSNLDIELLGVEFHDGTNIELKSKLVTDKPNEDYEVAGGVVMPAGEYSWREYSLRYNTPSRDDLSFSNSIGGGEYYDGNIIKFNSSIIYRPSPAIKVGLSYSENRGSLPGGDFTTRLESLSINCNFGPDISWDTLLQADNESDTLGVQSRFRYILEDGRELFFVADSGWEELPNRTIVPMDNNLTLKLVYAIRF